MIYICMEIRFWYMRDEHMFEWGSGGVEGETCDWSGTNGYDDD